jgi:hypothetical protein
MKEWTTEECKRLCTLERKGRIRGDSFTIEGTSNQGDRDS